jgi:PAS domain S-box-containing protein
VDFFTSLFDTSDFPRRWDCGLWTPAQGWLHILSDLGVWSAYLAIPGVLGFFLLRKKDVPFRSVFWLFGAFILACGATHLMEAVIFWWPAYRLAGLIKLLTAVASWATVISLVPVVPRALAMRSPGELEREAAGRRRAEEKFRETEERFRQLVENIREIFWMQEGGWERLLYMSPAYEDAWGRSCQGLYEQPRSWIESVPPEDRDLIFAHLEQQARGISTETEFRVVRPDGSVRWMRCRAFPIGHQAGEAARTAGLVEDITDRKRAEEALRESEHRWRSLTEALPQLVWTATPDGACDYFSTQWTQHTAVPESHLLGWRWLEVLHPDDREPTKQLWNDSVAGRGPYDVEYRIRGRDGTYRWFKTRGVPIRDGAGHIVKWFGTCTDVTAGKQLEEELRQANTRLELAVCGSNVRIWDCDMPDGEFQHGRVYTVNFWEHLGYRPEIQAEFATLLSLVHPDDREAAMRNVQACLSGETKGFEAEFRVRHTDGTYRWMLSRGVAVRNAAGLPVRFIGSDVDITDLKRAEEALRESEERFRGTFENAAVGIAHIDAESRCLRANQKMCEILGYRGAELVGKTVPEVTHPDDLAPNLFLFGNLMRGELPTFAMEKRFFHKDGSIVSTYLTVSPQRDEVGKPAYAIVMVQDISELKRMERELRRAVEAAEAANRAKDEFLANVSHEIRTPMNAILGMTELALDTPLAEDQRQYLKTVKSAADNLLGILNDLLDFSKIEAGKLELDPGDFSLRAALADTLRTLAMRAHKKGLELVSHVQPDVPDALVGDASRLRQVLLNLVGNAIKFTDQGEVVVRVEADGGPAPDGEVGLRFAVTDTGIGIPTEKQGAIFRAFEQEDTSTTRKYGGTGLGLTIAARLAALMSGAIGVESRPGRGSTFTFTARFGRQEHPPEPAPPCPPVSLEGLHVLVVDDNATNRRILEEWLRGWRLEPAAAGDGLAALDALWGAVAAGRPFDLVLLDARMPDTDGLSLAAKIRKRPELSDARIILFTSGDRPGDPARARELRLDAHLLKPVQPDELLEAIHGVMSRAQGDAPAARETAPVAAPTADPLHVLVAEDNEFNAQLLEQLLVRRGHRVRVANNGRAALALAEDGGFDLMLLDVHMPELDGFQVVRAVRERERTAGGHLPIIALTARSRKEDHERCLAAGMDEFLPKPIRAADLWAASDRVATARPPAERDGLALLDPRVLLAACGEDAVILEKICGALRAGLPDQVAAVEEALDAGDAPRVREAAHRLCGMLAAYSTAAGGVASEVEDHAADGRLEQARPLAQQLATMARELMRLVGGLSLETLRHQAEVAGSRVPTAGPGDTRPDGS